MVVRHNIVNFDKILPLYIVPYTLHTRSSLRSSHPPLQTPIDSNMVISGTTASLSTTVFYIKSN